MKPTMIRNPTGRQQKLTRRILSSMAMPTVALGLFVVAQLGLGSESAGPPAFEIPWHTIDGGGRTSEGGQFTVSGTIGQPDAGVMIGGGLELSGGFWSAFTVVQLPGDCEHDGDVDLDDYTCFFDCVLGPGQGLLPDCEPFDLDNDGDVDIADYSIFEILFN